MKTLVTASLLALGLMACKDREPSPDVLPEATQTGANTGGALVDGKVWVAKVENIGPYTGGLANLYNVENGKYKARIYLSPLSGSGQIAFDIESISDFIVNIPYVLNDQNVNRAIYSNGNQAYYTDAQNTGTITFTRFDKVNHIFSGTFSFKAKDNNGNVVNITNGRFDKKFTN